MRRVLHTALPDRVAQAVDVGCGPASWLQTWRTFADNVVGVDPFADAIAQQSLPEGTRVVRGTADKLPFDTDSVDLALALDVLEHIDDASALVEIRRILRRDGLVLVTVPAIPWLWSTRDDDAGHLRRYTKSSLHSALETAGFDVLDSRYYMSLLFPLVAASRVLGRNTPTLRDKEDQPPRLANAVFRAITLFEVRTGLRLPFGSSLLALARIKP